jgi:sugar-specific transcriptional regulator TrmB
MARMTEAEQVQLARELAASSMEEIVIARKEAESMFRQAFTRAEMQRWTTTLRMYEGLEKLRENIAKLEA